MLRSMQRSDRLFVILFAVILVVGTVLVVIGVRVGGERATAQGARMEASAGAARALLQLHYAMERSRIDALRDADEDGEGEWRQVEGGLQRGGYRFHVVLPTAVDDAEQRYAVVALPRQADWPLLAIDPRGDVRIAPPDFTPDGDAPVDPSLWPVWR